MLISESFRAIDDELQRYPKLDTTEALCRVTAFKMLELLYIPTLSSVMRNENIAEIKRQYNDGNADELGKKYGVSPRTIVRIVTKKLER